LAKLSIKAISELLGNPELADLVTEPCACGAPRVLSLGLNTVSCADKGCPCTVAARLHAIAEKYQMADMITLSEFEYLCQERYYRSWIDFFTDDWVGTDYEELYNELVDAIKAELDVPAIVMLSGFDCLATDQIYNLCGDFQTVSDLASVIDTDGFVFIAERLGLTASHLVPVVVHIYNNLATRLPEMLEAEDIFSQ